MLITKEHVEKAMNFSAAEVSHVLRDYNVGEPCYKSAEYTGMNYNGCFVYEISYYDIDSGDTEKCNVFIWYEFDADKKKNVLVGDF